MHIYHFTVLDVSNLKEAYLSCCRRVSRTASLLVAPEKCVPPCLFRLWRLPVFLGSWTLLHLHTIQVGAPTLSLINTLASVITLPPLILTQRISVSPS